MESKLNEKLATTEGLLYRRGNFNDSFDQLILDGLMAQKMRRSHSRQAFVGEPVFCQVRRLLAKIFWIKLRLPILTQPLLI